MSTPSRKELLAALTELIGPDSVLHEHASGDCWCNLPDEESGETGILVCDCCRARAEVKAIKVLLSRAQPEGVKP